MLPCGRAVVARRAHNPQVAGSNPARATKKKFMSTGRKILIAGMASGATLIIAYILYQKYWSPAAAAAATAATGTVDATSVPSDQMPSTTPSTLPVPGGATTIANAPMETVTPTTGSASVLASLQGPRAALFQGQATAAPASASTGIRGLFKTL